MNKSRFWKEHWLIALLIGLALCTSLCGCRYSLIRFESMEATVEYYDNNGVVNCDVFLKESIQLLLPMNWSQTVMEALCLLKTKPIRNTGGWKRCP